MADRNERVMEMVRREIDRDPGVELGTLVEKAKEIDPSVAELTPRQFHARYPLQVKRSRNRGAPKKAKRARKRASRALEPASPAPRRPARETPASGRDAIRAIFLEFAGEVAGADSRQEIVGVLSSVDAYVDRVEKLVRR